VSNPRQNASGFTLLELMITIFMLSIVLVAVSPMIAQQQANARKLLQSEEIRRNKIVATALLTNAADNTALGTLRAPVTFGTVTSGIYNPGDSTAANLAFGNVIAQGGVIANAINTDAKSTKPRAYQMVTGLSKTTPLFFRNGPTITLNYEFGAIYSTECLATSCNPTVATGLPGDSIVLTAANITSWDIAGDDFGVIPISTLSLQKSMQELTGTKLNELRDYFRNYVNAKQLEAESGLGTNFFPIPTGAGASDFSGANPTSNQGCHNGWYSLASGTVNVLAQLNLTSDEYAATAWGADIQYCADYDPSATGTSTADAAPHNGALRVNKNLSTGAPPSGTAADNVVLPI